MADPAVIRRPPRGTPKPPVMAEAELQSAVIKLCKLYGLEWHHQQYSLGSKKGWPDLVIAGRSLLFRELKREGAEPTAAQLHWLAVLKCAGADAGVWRPSDLASGRVQRELEAVR